ncbi:type II secretion system protein J [Acinetobacter ursingii ANC 3649]|uniref:Type II secretion system protein J n=1 Tax=Acinetobacter ursingii ANC 3649 TaxID=1257043 RepID=N9D9C0_9GAMM|nr:type II secretion system protein J [Acinetobacter ursingii ANC 3649]
MKNKKDNQACNEPLFSRRKIITQFQPCQFTYDFVFCAHHRTQSTASQSSCEALLLRSSVARFKLRHSKHSFSPCAHLRTKSIAFRLAAGSSVARLKPASGFTLVELLVAIAIFAVLSALGWKVFDYLIKTKDRNAQHEEQLFILQDAYQQILRDTLQIIPLTANMNGQIRPALSLNNNVLQFSKAGVTDPLGQGVSPYERIEYRYDASQKVVYRLKYSDLNLPNSVQPQSSILLKNVEQFQINVLNPQALNQWPDVSLDFTQTQNLKLLPAGLKINITIAGTEYEWIYSLLDTKPIVLKQQQNDAPSNNNNSTNNTNHNSTNQTGQN